MLIRRYFLSHILVVPILAAAGCASAPATLQNTDTEHGTGRVAALFTAIDGAWLQEGVWVPPADTRYQVPAGKNKIVSVRVVHDPKTSYLSSNVFETCLSVPAALKAGGVYVVEPAVQGDVATVSIKDKTSGEPVSDAVTGKLVALDPVRSCALEAAVKN
jgi:hypothetical protein